VLGVGIVAVNFVLKVVLTALARFERHSSVTSEESAITIKLFLAQMTNTALIVLLVNGRLPNSIHNSALLTPIQGVGLLKGEFPDFLPHWYASVGFSIVITMGINSLVPHAAPVGKLYVLRPLQRWMQKRKALTQRGLNLAMEGPEFHIAPRYAQVQHDCALSCGCLLLCA
jgi:hypothetical protein